VVIAPNKMFVFSSYDYDAYYIAIVYLPVLLRNVHKSFKSGVFLVLSRIVNVETETEADQELVEFELDRLKNFVEAFGRGFQERNGIFCDTLEVVQG
jgi:hypothetical protein